MNRHLIALTFAMTLGLFACTAPIPEGTTEPTSSVPVIETPLVTPVTPLEPDTQNVPFGGLKIFGGFASSQVANDLTVDASNNVYLVGYLFGQSDGSLGMQLPSKSDTATTSGFVMKISPRGTLLWVRLIGSNGNDSASKVAVHTDGSVYVAGTAGGALCGKQVGSKSTANFLTRFDANGRQLWVNQFGNRQSEITALQLDSSGEPQLGVISHTSLQGAPNATGAGAFVIHGSKDGPFKDTRTFLRTNPTAAILSTWALDVQFDANLNVYVGSLENTNAFDQTSDITFSKFDANGSHQFNLELTHLSFYADPHYTVEANGVVFRSFSYRGMFQQLDRYDSNGTLLWSIDRRSALGQKYSGAPVNGSRAIGDQSMVVAVANNQYELIKLDATGAIAKTFVALSPTYRMDARENYYFFGSIPKPGSPELSSVFVSKYNRNFELQ
jgi:hypothetical protein